ncbi:hypothetical protein Pcinc_027853 [Petrolisthes cinctipes]|uniref:Uncharacterized protein n=1 Tax=Petrolisthes cinctipes TaxID=88211 RepID=A0AAE1F3K5_PETCI|nr:hypothetical protein Pcinc_027853 [Petrolisthes cinctipes]
MTSSFTLYVSTHKHAVSQCSLSPRRHHNNSNITSRLLLSISGSYNSLSVSVSESDSRTLGNKWGGRVDRKVEEEMEEHPASIPSITTTTPPITDSSRAGKTTKITTDSTRADKTTTITTDSSRRGIIHTSPTTTTNTTTAPLRLTSSYSVVNGGAVAKVRDERRLLWDVTHSTTTTPTAPKTLLPSVLSDDVGGGKGLLPLSSLSSSSSSSLVKRTRQTRPFSSTSGPRLQQPSAERHHHVSSSARVKETRQGSVGGGDVSVFVRKYSQVSTPDDTSLDNNRQDDSNDNISLANKTPITGLVTSPFQNTSTTTTTRAKFVPILPPLHHHHHHQTPPTIVRSSGSNKNVGNHNKNLDNSNKNVGNHNKNLAENRNNNVENQHRNLGNRSKNVGNHNSNLGGNKSNNNNNSPRLIARFSTDAFVQRSTPSSQPSLRQVSHHQRASVAEPRKNYSSTQTPYIPLAHRYQSGGRGEGSHSDKFPSLPGPDVRLQSPQVNSSIPPSRKDTKSHRKSSSPALTSISSLPNKSVPTFSNAPGSPSHQNLPNQVNTPNQHSVRTPLLPLSPPVIPKHTDQLSSPPKSSPSFHLPPQQPSVQKNSPSFHIPQQAAIHNNAPSFHLPQQSSHQTSPSFHLPQQSFRETTHTSGKPVIVSSSKVRIFNRQETTTPPAHPFSPGNQDTHTSPLNDTPSPALVLTHPVSPPKDLSDPHTAFSFSGPTNVASSLSTGNISSRSGSPPDSSSSSSLQSSPGSQIGTPDRVHTQPTVLGSSGSKVSVPGPLGKTFTISEPLLRTSPILGPHPVTKSSPITARPLPVIKFLTTGPPLLTSSASGSTPVTTSSLLDLPRNSSPSSIQGFPVKNSPSSFLHSSLPVVSNSPVIGSPTTGTTGVVNKIPADVPSVTKAISSVSANHPYLHPNNNPPIQLNNNPTIQPNNYPSIHPNNNLSIHPNNNPSIQPNNNTSIQPKNNPPIQPNNNPSSLPNHHSTTRKLSFDLSHDPVKHSSVTSHVPDNPTISLSPYTRTDNVGTEKDHQFISSRLHIASPVHPPTYNNYALPDDPTNLNNRPTPLITPFNPYTTLLLPGYGNGANGGGGGGLGGHQGYYNIPLQIPPVINFPLFSG